MSPHPLNIFETQKYYQSEPRFNGDYSQYNLPKTHWVALYAQNNNVTYFDSFDVEDIVKEIKAFISNKNIKANIFRIQAYASIMCKYFCIGFIDFILAGKTLTEFANLFLPNNFKKNDDIILNYFLSNI